MFFARMSNMMSGFGGMTGDDQWAGHQPTSQQPSREPAGGQPDSSDTTTPESNPGNEGTNPGAGGFGAGGYSNIFQL